jgi:hypothetical protein
MRTIRIGVASVWLGLALAACSDTTGSITDLNPAGSAPAALSGSPLPIAIKPGAPPLAATHASFWAVQGRTTGVEIAYRPSLEGEVGLPFLEFTVPAKAQLVDPTGRPLARGDSILIDIHVVPGQLAARFSPEGLVFAGKTPAELAISYLYGDVVDPARRLAIWYQPCDGGAWELQSGRIDRKREMVVGDIAHFSNYAVAYRK